MIQSIQHHATREKWYHCHQAPTNGAVPHRELAEDDIVLLTPYHSFYYKDITIGCSSMQRTRQLLFESQMIIL